LILWWFSSAKLYKILKSTKQNSQKFYTKFSKPPNKKRKNSSRRPAIPKPAKVCGLCKPEFFPSPEERGYRERWSPSWLRGDGGVRKKPSLFLSSKKDILGF
jgi:hypothetical protein